MKSEKLSGNYLHSQIDFLHNIINKLTITAEASSMLLDLNSSIYSSLNKGLKTFEYLRKNKEFLAKKNTLKDSYYKRA